MRAEEASNLFIAGLTFKEICARMGISRWLLCNYFRLPYIQRKIMDASNALWEKAKEELSNERVNLVKSIQEASARAFERMCELMESEDERVAQKAAADILDRNSETSKTHRVDSTTRVMTLDATQLALAAQAAVEIESAKEGSQ